MRQSKTCLGVRLSDSFAYEHIALRYLFARFYRQNLYAAQSLQSFVVKSA